MRKIGTLLIATLGAIAIAAPPPAARAAFHIAVIDEVVASLDGDVEQQFVEIRMLIANQNVTANSVLATFGADGTHTGDLLIVPTNVATGLADGRWSMATQAFQSTHGFTADFTMMAGLPVDGGMVCWGAPGIVPPADPASWDHADPSNYVDCVAYGSFSGPSNVHIGTPTPLTPDGHSLNRVSETDDNANDFGCGDPVTPANNAGSGDPIPATAACETQRGSGIQTTPDEKRTLVSKDIGGERWAITRNNGDGSVTGNVFFPEGGDPLFLWCEQTAEDAEGVTLSCQGADPCAPDACPDFTPIAEVALPRSFFQTETETSTGLHDHPPHSPTGVGRASGVVLRESGVQLTPDDLRALISKDVGGERWAITRNLDDLTVTGNVFFPEGGEPLFLWCEQTATDGVDLTLDCFGSDACSPTACPAFEFIAEVALPSSFFATIEADAPSPTPEPQATPAGGGEPQPTATPEPSVEPTPAQTPAATPAPTAEPTPEPTAQPTPEETPEPTMDDDY